MTMDDSERQLADLIRKLQRRITWKPGSATRHLLKRKLRGHLPANASLDDYENLIQGILHSADASIYLYTYKDTSFLTIAMTFENHTWLVITSFDGVMETAFVVENPANYLERPAFRYIGRLGEVLK